MALSTRGSAIIQDSSQTQNINNNDNDTVGSQSAYVIKDSPSVKNVTPTLFASMMAS